MILNRVTSPRLQGGCPTRSNIGTAFITHSQESENADNLGWIGSQEDLNWIFWVIVFEVFFYFL